MSTASKPTDFATIEGENLFRVFSNLSFKERVKCERVCKRWQEIVGGYNASRQTSIALFPFGERVVPQNFCSDALHKIDIEMCAVVRSERSQGTFHLKSVLMKCPNLRSLHLRCDEEIVIRDYEIAYISQYCPKIEHLSIVDDLSGILIHGHTHKIVHDLGHVKHLQLRFPATGSCEEIWLQNAIVNQVLDIAKDTIEVLSVNVPLDIDNCYAMTNNCKLQALIMHGTTIPTSCLNTFLHEGNATAKQLKSLDLVIDDPIQLLMICESMECLTTLHVVVGSSANVAIGKIRLLTSLRTLFISSWSDESLDDGLLEMMKGCNKLQSLTVNGEVTDKALKQLSSHCPNLNHLEVALNNTKGDQITDTTIDEALVNLLGMKYLSLQNCNISDNGIRRLLDSVQHHFDFLKITTSSNLTKKVIGHCIEFASRKPWEMFRVALPVSLQDVSIHLPLNLRIVYD